MPCCCVVDCKNKSATVNYTKDGISFHALPQDPTIKEKWITATGRGPNWFPTKNSTICSTHFTQECFQPLAKKRRLFEWAVPTLKLRKVWTTDSMEASKANDDESEVNDDDEIPDSANDSTTNECVKNEDDPALSITTYSITSNGVVEREEELPKKKLSKKETPEIRKLHSLIKKQKSQILKLQKQNSRYLKKIEQLKIMVKNLKEERKPRWC